jgi:hypothetical protein
MLSMITHPFRNLIHGANIGQSRPRKAHSGWAKNFTSIHS